MNIQELVDTLNEPWKKKIENIKAEILSTIDYEQGDDLCDYVIDVDEVFFIIDKHIGRCNTCEFKHLKSECLGCEEYDERGNLIDLHNYKKEDKE